MPQAWEGREMLPNDPGVLLGSVVKDLVLAGSRFLRQNVVDRKPISVFQMQRIQHSIADVQQLLITG